MAFAVDKIQEPQLPGINAREYPQPLNGEKRKENLTNTDVSAQQKLGLNNQQVELINNKMEG